jgi:predicted nucleic acid-binding protein
LTTVDYVSISRLTVLEMRCLLSRRRRNREMDPGAEKRAITLFEEQIAQGFFEVHPLEDRHAIRAQELIVQFPAIPLRTLDALHLSVALDLGASLVMTSDRVFATAGRALRLRVKWFGSAD